MKILAACYRKGEAGDPEIYAAACGAVLSEYPVDVIMLVTDPRTGLPSQSQWLPTVKEIRDACDEIVEVQASKAKRERDLRRQMEDRAKFEAEQASKSSRPTYEEIVADCAARGLPVHPRPTEQLAPQAMKAKYGISDAAWNMIPDAKDTLRVLPDIAKKMVKR